MVGWHLIFGQELSQKRLKSRESFFRTCEPLKQRPADELLEKWKKESTNPNVI